MKNILWSLLLITCAALAVGWWQSRSGETNVQRERPLIPVTAYVIALREFRDEASALGTLRAWV